MWWVLPHIDMNQPRRTGVPHSRTPSHHPPHPIPLGCPRAPALSALLHASICTGHLFHVWQYTCFKSSHPRLLPQSPKSLFFTSVSLLQQILKTQTLFQRKQHLNIFTLKSFSLVSLKGSSARASLCPGMKAPRFPCWVRAASSLGS